ncbi:nicotinate-nucleotide--dimethylbenzimidazole phosphoribosyltransferase [Ovoidimarina sediminis]|uniref:nicotinate-nucleotide--dimethylbenzimidazole phosphoribosyltransferase n=1 Tax=Ovoidimarina sediminis TaxID=3079856 RepID=UPI002909E9DA|nr:nicotinate-nucleotide--dimethylbenzimidazole phosphoribosyltransferase [Rhodophyticola sp. MJ-SS7]MDU8944392.1 nicotinate-nucleotide--dimethylbenzimidazole phosphoribosyltransferase [Rhodophyticola sp. MJ-SS7]
MDLSGPAFDAALQAAIDGKTKPPGSLGRIETLAGQIARLQGTLAPRTGTLAHIVFAADHGIARAGVSAYPQEVTRQMVANFVAGGAASNVFARSVGASLAVVDAGVAGGPLGLPDLLEERIGEGTANALDGPAMTPAQRDAALATGRTLGAGAGTDALSLGEMGIGNTSAAALIAAKLTGRPMADLVGRGTGLDDAGLKAKTDILTEAAARTPATLDAAEALAQYGGFEIAMMAGAMLGAASENRLVLVDGYIATAAAALAIGLDPAVKDALVFCHLSAEPGHRLLCAHLGADPLLDLGLRLGEGTGALLAWPLVKAAGAMLREMASFESAGVSREG